MKKCKTFVQGLVKTRPFPGFILVIAFFLWDMFMVKGFSRQSSLRYFTNVMVPLACLSIGLTVTIITGGIDLSTGALVCVVNCSMVVLLEHGVPLAAAITIGILIAVAVGFINGLVISYLRISPLLVTYAMQIICSGLALLIRPIASGTGDQGYLNWYSRTQILGIPVSLIVFVALPLIGWYLIKATPMGKWLYAVGNNEKKAFETGINTKKVIIFAYAFCGLMVGIGAIAFSGNIVGGDPKAGLSFTMNAVAAAVVGGASLSGGEGDPMGGLFGALFINLATYAVLGAKVSTYFEELASGLIILIGVVGMMLYNMLRDHIKEARQ